MRSCHDSHSLFREIEKIRRFFPLPKSIPAISRFIVMRVGGWREFEVSIVSRDTPCTRTDTTKSYDFGIFNSRSDRACDNILKVAEGNWTFLVDGSWCRKWGSVEARIVCAIYLLFFRSISSVKNTITIPFRCVVCPSYRVSATSLLRRQFRIERTKSQSNNGRNGAKTSK